MAVLDQVKETVETLVNDVKGNVTEVQGKAEDQYGKVVENYKEAIESLKGETANLNTTFTGYKERISTKLNKHFNGEEIVADLKEEVEFFSNEFKNSFERVKGAFTK